MTHRSRVFIILFLTLFFSLRAYAGVMDTALRDGRLESISALGNQTLTLQGKGVFRYLGVKLYSAAFYAGAGAGPAKRLVINYLHDIPRDAIVQAAEKNLKNNPEINYSKIKSRVDRMHSTFTDIKTGDEYALVYSSGKTWLYRNRKPSVEIEGADFAEAYFSIWLSKYSINQKLRKELLGISK